MYNSFFSFFHSPLIKLEEAYRLWRQHQLEVLSDLTPLLS